MKALTNDEQKKVQGGWHTGDREERFCKYCNQVCLQEYYCPDHGWDANGKGHDCNLWICTKCSKTNYYDEYTDILI